MQSSNRRIKTAEISFGSTKYIIGVIVVMLNTAALISQTEPNVRQGNVSDWTHHHVLFPESRDPVVMSRLSRDPRWQNDWNRRHQAPWRRRRHGREKGRDWAVSLGATTYGPLFDFSFNIPPQNGFGTLNTIDQGSGQFLATAGTVTVTGGADLGTYPLLPGGPAVTTSPAGAFLYDNLIYYQTDPPLDMDGLLFTAPPDLEINIWGNSPDNYSFYDHTGAGYGTQLTEAGTFTPNVDPGGGQTFPAKYVFDITAAPNCANDFVAIGIASSPTSGGQANIVGFNNLYSTQGPSAPTPLCGTTGPAVMFAYASGTGEVPASLTLSLDGTQLAYIENLGTGSSYFHVLTLGTTGGNGTSPTNAAVPGSGNNAVDQAVLLSPDGGITTQSSTTAPYVVYTNKDTQDVAFATTYSWAGGGSGYLYKLGNVFSGTPFIIWSIPIDSVPSAPVYDSVSNKVFFTDSDGRIDYVVDGGAPTVVYGSVLAAGATSENPVTIDSTNEMVYACFNSNGTNAIVVQAPTSMASTTSIPVGASGTIYTGPYDVEFNNAWRTGSGTPFLYVVGTRTGALPTLYSVGFNGAVLDPTSVTSTPLTTDTADASPLTEIYNASLLKDYLFVSVTNNCIAAIGGGSAGCVMSLDITDGFPTVNASTTALAAAGGTTGMIIDNESALTQASSIYYATKTQTSLVKATQAGLN